MGLRKRGKIWYLRLKADGEEFPALSLGTTKKTEAASIEAAIKIALKDRNPSILNEIERGVVQRILAERVEEFLPGFKRVGRHQRDEQDLTVHEACEMAYKDREVREKSAPYRQRFKCSVFHLLEHLGSETPVKAIKVRDIMEYRYQRKEEQAAAATINKEVCILSKVFRILKVKERVTDNPCSLVPALPTRDSQRQVYVSLETFRTIVAGLPDWFKPIAELGYYCGMRQGEIWTLTRSQIDLKNRIIRLSPSGTKERDHKSVPMPVFLAQKLVGIMGGTLVGIDLVFLRDGLPIRRHNLKRPWERAVKAAGFPDLTFHDLRHTWRRNARKSGMDPDLRKSIMGHWFRGKSVDEAYDLFDDEDRVEAIDQMTYDHGETRILTPKRKKDPKRRKPAKGKESSEETKEQQLPQRTDVGGYKRGTTPATEKPLRIVVKRRSARGGM